MAPMTRVYGGDDDPKAFAIVDRVLDATRDRATDVVRTKAGRYSVGFLIYVPERDSVILVGQNRTAMISDSNPNGYVVEVPAGRCDRPESVKATIAREASEEVGAMVEEDQIVLLNDGVPLAMSPGILDELMYLAYIELDEGQLSPDRKFGLADEGEVIDRMLVPTQKACDTVCVDMKTKALLWYLRVRIMNEERFSMDKRSR